MTNYRRNFVVGGTYFFTVNLANRNQSLLVDHIDILRTAFRYTKTRHPFIIQAIVVLPDHLHTIWTLPTGETDFSLRWRLIKTFFSRNLPRTENQLSKSRLDKGERGIWQRRYWEHTLQNDSDYINHVDYIHFNPVKHGCVNAAKDWPHSSFHRFVKLVIYPIDWARSETNNHVFGER